MKNDMTNGSPLRLMILFTIPVLIGNVFQNVYNLVDSVIVGQFLGVNALAAVGMTGTLTFLVFGWVNGMASGFGILLAQSFGASDEKKAAPLYGDVCLSVRCNGAPAHGRASGRKWVDSADDECAG